MGYDKQTLNKIYQKTDGYCHLCGKKLSRTNYGSHGYKGAWHVDHSRAIANGGSHHMNNLFAACISCNSEKGTLHKTTIRRRKGYGQEDSSGCFITTACVTSQGLPDDCYELQVLRKFRDTYVVAQLGGKKLLDEYYITAPLIVEQINKQRNAVAIYQELYKNIQEAVKLIEQMMHTEAFNLYCLIVNDLKKKILASSAT